MGNMVLLTQVRDKMLLVKKATAKLADMIKGEAEFEGYHFTKEERLEWAKELCRKEFRYEIIKQLAKDELTYSNIGYVFRKVNAMMHEKQKQKQENNNG